MSEPEFLYCSTKTYAHSVGLSCCFRQWRAESHCNKLHGYALEVKLVFVGELDERNWVQDFGGLKHVKQYLQDMFDHKTLVAEDDPNLRHFLEMHECDIIDIVVVEHVGCEKFAEMIFKHILTYHADVGEKLKSVEVREHAGNSAIVMRKG